MLVAGELACCYLLVGDRANAEPAAREALAVSGEVSATQYKRHLLISYIAALSAECKRERSESAR